MLNLLPWQPRIIAHRGGSWPHWPENCGEGFLAAADAGFASECDVWASSDGEPVVIHDEKLDRTTSGVGRVSQFSAAKLETITLKSASDVPLRIPMLREVVQFISLVEIKPHDARALVGRVIEMMQDTEWTMIAFDEANVRHALECNGSTQVALLADQLPALELAIAQGWDAYVDHALLNVETMRRLRDAGLSVGTWTVNTQEELAKIVPLKPDVIISDVPMMIRLWLGQAGIAV